jgi:hypothetical protein
MGKLGQTRAHGLCAGARVRIGERTRLACWQWRLAIANFLFDIVRTKACFGAAPKAAREARALPGNSQRAV